MTLSAATRQEIESHKQRYPQARSAVLPSLWAAQHEIGHLSVDAMREVATILELTPSEVQAVATFYSMYFQKPAGEHSVVICKNVSCALRDADALTAHVAESLGCASGGTTEDGKFTWEVTVECLGACGGAPAMQVDHHFYENLTPDKVDAVLEEYRHKPPQTLVGGHADTVVAPADSNKSDQPRGQRARVNPEDL